MPDWVHLVRQRLHSLGLSPAREEEVIIELAGHLNDVYAGWIQRGFSEREATDLTLREVPDWVALRRRIYRAEQLEENMNQRVKSLWAPGLLTLVLFIGMISVLQRIALEAHFIKLGNSHPRVFYWPFYVFLPLVGACGAYFSRCAGGKVWARVVVGLFPLAFFLATLMFVELPALLLAHRQQPLNLSFPAVVAYLLGWVIIPPGVALLLGVVPFLRGRRARAGA